MFKVLVVDDSYAKFSSVFAALSEAGVDKADVAFLSDATSAKNAMKTNYYDLVILDIVLPLRLGDEPKKETGINLMREIIRRPGYKLPGSIISLTYYSDALDEFSAEFKKELVHVIQYSESNDSWKEALMPFVHRSIQSKSHQDHNGNFQSFLVIVCALEKPELKSVLNNGWKWQPLKLDNDHTQYYKTSLATAEGTKVIYAAAASRMGMPATTVLAAKMILEFKPKYIGMTGIAAGVRSKTKVGDVIIADPVWDWGSGKWVLGDNDEILFESEPYQISIDVDLRRTFKELANDKTSMGGIKDGWQGDTPDHDITLHVGPVASGASVLADGNTLNNLVVKQHRKLLGIEMETFGLYIAAQEMCLPRPLAFSIKSVVDFADGEKNDKYHKYSSYVSAMVLTKLVESYL